MKPPEGPLILAMLAVWGEPVAPSAERDRKLVVWFPAETGEAHADMGRLDAFCRSAYAAPLGMQERKESFIVEAREALPQFF